MRQSRIPGTCGLAIAILFSITRPTAAAERKGPIDAYISTGDAHWVSSLLPCDSPASIEASFDVLKNVTGARRVYWRGLEEATWVASMQERPENPRYYSFWQWIREVYRQTDPDKRAVAAAHARGMEIWGMATMFDWGGGGDTPCSGDFPMNCESRLRKEHPEWAPIDRHGIRRQGGPIELAYPEARKALVDLHVKEVLRAGYDGMAFLTYCENYSIRYEGEFGYSDPIVADFKKQFGLDLRTQPFTRFATREDWIRLRGQYVTEYLRELKTELAKHGKKLGVVLNPWNVHKPQAWNVPETISTAGNQYFDVETWVKEQIVDCLLVYGYCNRATQVKAIDDCLWLTRDTNVEVGALTSSAHDPQWQPIRDRGVSLVSAINEDPQFYDRGIIPEQPLSALHGHDPLLAQRALAQVISGKLKAAVDNLKPLAGEANLITRRLALLALGKSKDPAAVATLENGLDDPENCVRGVAAIALRETYGPNSAQKLIHAIEQHGNHMLREAAVPALMRIKPPPRELMLASLHSNNPEVRLTAARVLTVIATNKDAAALTQALADEYAPVRYFAAMTLGNLHRSSESVESLRHALAHADPVVANRAAVSLGAMAARSEPAFEPVRLQVVADLKAAFLRFNSGYHGVDEDWGYRAVGNALLDCKEPGAAALRELMADKDPVVADLAWRALDLPQRASQFTFSTEPETEAALRDRPAGAHSGLRR
ncbi:MAG TPA: HEAT repeat domain-containing protein [Tepidisphaeraceae bacterium]|nr:HEAT repeat domain-containing protein [Tepidisphaeraceae bacterium]